MGNNIEIWGAREHNLRNIDLSIPRNKLVVITGLSGSGKSSLAFDTIFAEGQRRYMETFASYARQYIGEMKRPDVEKIDGLSPVISIEQKTTSRNPRSTVGTVTEIYDFLRLLYARVADAYSYETGKKMVRFTEEQVIQTIFETHKGLQVYFLSPLVKGRKGHYRPLFEQYLKKGFSRMRIDGKIKDIVPNMQVGRYSVHDIELLIDRLTISDSNYSRIRSSIQLALKEGKGNLMVLVEDRQSPYYYSKNLVCEDTGISYNEPQPSTFSFNSPYGACPECKGFGQVFKIDRETLILDENQSIRNGGLLIAGGGNQENWLHSILTAILIRNGISPETPVGKLPKNILDKIINGTSEIVIVTTAFMDYEVKFEGLIERYNKLLHESDDPSVRQELENVIPLTRCPECGGSRLKKESLFFKIDDKNIFDASSMQIDVFLEWAKSLENKLEGQRKIIGNELLKEIITRTGFIADVGLTYLTLDRPVYSLSGGESQRIRLATQIGSQLVNVTYIIDEPSIGLHQRDNQRLIHALQNLRDVGNSIIVVEHDKEMMLSSDYLVDLGPRAGLNGGKVMFQGKIEDIGNAGSVTSDYLTGKKKIEIPSKRRPGNGDFLEITGARGNNLKSVNVKIPLGTLVCITGVSGSGKSTLINETISPILKKKLYRASVLPLDYDEITGLEHIDKIIEIDQSPIGRTPRSNPATYTGVFTNIRSLFADLQEAKIRGYAPGRFSFNVKGGRCEECQGAGMKSIEMNFLPDVNIECPVCRGLRYNRETLEVRFKGKSINDVLNLTHNQALEFFENLPQIKRKIQTMVDVGMGYVKLGQQSTTLSGGEAQRIKLSAELSKRDTGKTLFILDEPTTGLHFEDIRILMEVVNKFVKRGNTVIIIEHNLDVIKLADYIIDLGPEGGSEGGEVVAVGTPEQIAKKATGHTARFLRTELGF